MVEFTFTLVSEGRLVPIVLGWFLLRIWSKYGSGGEVGEVVAYTEYNHKGGHKFGES